MIVYVRWRDATNPDGHWLYGRWRGMWERDGSLRVYELEPNHNLPRDAWRSRATRSLWEDRLQVAECGPRRGTRWVPFMRALDKMTDAA